MWKIVLAPVAFAIFVLGTVIAFYEGPSYEAPPAPDIAFEQIATVPEASVDHTDQPVFTASPVGDGLRGKLLIDGAHRNNFHPLELSPLLAKVAARGYSFSYTDASADVPLGDALSQVDSFVIVLPTAQYTESEIAAVVEFVEGGGKLLFIDDPGRFSQPNSVAEPVGISFDPDYLYNLDEYDTNFLEIYVNDFQADPITSGVNEMAFYYAGSITSAGPSLALTGGSTISSISEDVTGGRYAPIAVGAHRNVLALYDLTFMIPPYNRVKDNDRLIANVADFLTDSERTYRLTDYPRFLRGDVDIVVEDPGLIAEAAEMKAALAKESVSARLQGSENVGRDTVFLGLFESPASVTRYLEANGVGVGDTLDTPFIAGVPLDDLAIILLHSSGDRDVLVIMGDSAGSLSEAVDQLRSGKFRSGLVNDNTGVFKTK